MGTLFKHKTPINIMSHRKYADEQLVLMIQGDEPNQRNLALQQLYMDSAITYKVKELIVSYGNSKHDPDDILQEGIILLNELIRSGKFQERSKVRTFLIGICKNLLRNEVRKGSKVVLKEEIMDYEQKEFGSTPEDVIEIQEMTDAQLKRDELLRQLLNRLTANCQEVIRLYYFHAMNMAQIAKARGLKNANQAKKAASRCRQQLRDLIVDEPELAKFLKQTL